MAIQRIPMSLKKHFVSIEKCVVYSLKARWVVLQWKMLKGPKGVSMTTRSANFKSDACYQTQSCEYLFLYIYYI